MEPNCPKCNVELHWSVGAMPWTDEHYICTKCDGTYNIEEFCELCKVHTRTRQHHLTPRSKGGKETIACCETCEDYIHKTWTYTLIK